MTDLFGAGHGTQGSAHARLTRYQPTTPQSTRELSLALGQNEGPETFISALISPPCLQRKDFSRNRGVRSPL